MAEAHCRQAWNHTSALLALIYNIHRDPKRSSAKKPEDLNPHQERKKIPHEELPHAAQCSWKRWLSLTLFSSC